MRRARVEPFALPAERGPVRDTEDRTPAVLEAATAALDVCIPAVATTAAPGEPGPAAQVEGRSATPDARVVAAGREPGGCSLAAGTDRPSAVPAGHAGETVEAAAPEDAALVVAAAERGPVDSYIRRRSTHRRKALVGRPAAALTGARKVAVRRAATLAHKVVGHSRSGAPAPAPAVPGDRKPRAAIAAERLIHGPGLAPWTETSDLFPLTAPTRPRCESDDSTVEQFTAISIRPPTCPSASASPRSSCPSSAAPQQRAVCRPARRSLIRFTSSRPAP